MAALRNDEEREHCGDAVPLRVILADAHVDDATPVLGAPSEGEDVVSDYNPMSLPLGRYPFSPLR